MVTSMGDDGYVPTSQKPLPKRRINIFVDY
jgi:hypothetical protein